MSDIRMSDLVAIVGTGAQTQQFLVERAVLRAASPVFNAMLGPGCAWTEGHADEFELPEDHPKAFGIAMTLLHDEDAKPAQQINLELAYHLAVLTDKYDLPEVADAVVDFSLDGSISVLYEGTRNALIGTYVAWVFNIPTHFSIPAAEVVRGLRLDDHGRADLALPGFVAARDLDAVLEAARAKVISLMFDVVYNYMGQDLVPWCCPHGGRDCKTARSKVCDEILDALDWPEVRPDPRQIKSSIQDICDAVETVDDRCYPACVSSTRRTKCHTARYITAALERTADLFRLARNLTLPA